MKKFVLMLAMLVLTTVLVFAQTRTIKGRVTDETGAPVSGASIIIKGTSAGTSANENGEFSIAGKNGDVLVVSSTNYAANELRLGSAGNVPVILSRQAAINEVVVTALGQTRSRDRIGYSATTFRSEDIVRSAPVSALDGLQGRVAGADISTIGGTPGSSSRIILRGYSSLSTSGNSQALIVVDGVPFNNSRLGSFNDFLNSGGVDFGNGLNDINPNDIDNISILKGAAATSLYGSRASNGVVLITTKRGRAGKLSVDFTSSALFSSVAKLPDFQNVWGQGWNGLHYKEENGSWGPKMDGKDRLWGSTVDNSRLIKPFSAVEDNVKDFYDLGKELNNTIAVRGGNENANFYMSYGNVYSDGILPSNVDVYRRNTLSLRGQLKAEKFLASASLNYINKNGATPNNRDDATGSSTFENIIQIARDIPITDFKDYNNKFFNVNNYFTPYASNPYYSLFENGNKLQNDRMFGNIELGYDFNKAINIRWRTGVDVADARVKDWKAVERPGPKTWRGPNPTNFEGQDFTPLIGAVRELSDYAREINTDFFLNYNTDIASNLNLAGFFGFNYNERERRTQQSTITDLTIPRYYNITNSASPSVNIADLFSRRLIGAFAQANLSFKDYLFLSVSARNDWSSTLPINANSFFYPSVNTSIVVSKMADLSGAGISYLKLRAAVGKTGKDAPEYRLASVGLSGGNIGGGPDLGFGYIQFPLGGVSAFGLGNVIGNTSLKPELTTEYEFGTEVKFLKNRLGLDFSYYNRRTKGQILNVPIAPSTGYQSLVANFGLVENKGVEIALNVTPVQSRDFNWTMNYTFTKNNNKVLELPEGLEKVDFNSSYDVKMVARVGRPIGIIEAPKKMTTEDGRWIATTAGFFAQTPDDEEYGTIQRDFMMGLNNTFTYKNLSLGFNLDYRKGGVFVSRTADLNYFTGNAWLTQYNDRRPFIIPNSVVQTGTDAQGKPTYIENTTPVDVTNFNSYFYHTSNNAQSWENIILPKDFLKLRDITLSYRLPVSWANKINASAATLSVLGRNFLLWVPQKNTFIDPEVTNLGNDLVGEFGEQASSATTKSYGVSLRINF